MRTNLTLTLEEELLRSARKVALDRNTSVNQLVRDYLEQLVTESGRQRTALAALEGIFSASQARLGGNTWTRDELHER